jgi:hypothetical protein
MYSSNVNLVGLNVLLFGGSTAYMQPVSTPCDQSSDRQSLSNTKVSQRVKPRHDHLIGIRVMHVLNNNGYTVEYMCMYV